MAHHTGQYHAAGKENKESSGIREVKIEATGWYHFIATGRAVLKKSDDSKCWQELGGTGTLIHYLWDCKMVQPLWKILVVP